MSLLASFVLALTGVSTLTISGNWGVDLQAGSEFGYKLLFVVLLAGIFAIFMQVRALTRRIPVLVLTRPPRRKHLVSVASQALVRGAYIVPLSCGLIRL